MEERPWVTSVTRWSTEIHTRTRSLQKVPTWIFMTLGKSFPYHSTAFRILRVMLCNRQSQNPCSWKQQRFIFCSCVLSLMCIQALLHIVLRPEMTEQSILEVLPSCLGRKKVASGTSHWSEILLPGSFRAHWLSQAGWPGSTVPTGIQRGEAKQILKRNKDWTSGGGRGQMLGWRREYISQSVCLMLSCGDCSRRGAIHGVRPSTPWWQGLYPLTLCRWCLCTSSC